MKRAKESVKDAEFVLGRKALFRLLKRAGSYGALAIHESVWRENDNQSPTGNWNATHFGERCAGCHTSGVDSVAKTFQMVSLDCHTCHGLAVPEHTEDGALMPLSRQSKTLPEVEISICGSCHLRGGVSKSTGLPFPNNFVPGDNLFKDFTFDLSDKAISQEDPADAHVIASAREVVFNGNERIACTSCHEVHQQSSKKHEKLIVQPLCYTCHIEGKPMSELLQSERHNATCEY